MDRSRRRRRRAMAIALVVAPVSLALAVAWTAGGRIALQRLNRATGFSIVAGEARLTLVPPGLRLRGVRIAATASAPALLSARELRVRADVRDLVRGVPRAREITLADARLDARGPLGGTTGTLGLPPDARIAAERVRVDGLIVALPRKTGAPRLRLSALQLERVRIGAGAVRLAGEAVVAGDQPGVLRGRYTTSARRGTRARLEAALVDLRGLGVAGSGWRLRAGVLDGAIRYAAGVTDGLRGRLTVQALRAHAGATRVAAGRLAVRRLAAEPLRGVARAGLIVADRVRVAGGAMPALRIRGLVARDLSSERDAGRVLAAAALPAGGRLRAAGVIDPASRRLLVRAKLDAVALESVVGRAPRRAAAEGTISGRVTVAWPPLELGRGGAVLESLRVSAGGKPVAGARRVAIRLEHATLRPLRVLLGGAQLDGPWLRLWRDREGVQPIVGLRKAFHAPWFQGYLAAGPADAPAREAIAPGDLEVAIRDGAVTFEDDLAEPPVQVTVADVALGLRQRRTPPGSVVDGSASGSIGRSPVTLEGHADGTGRRVTAAIRDLELSPLRSWVASATGYAPTAGSLGAAVRIDLDRSGFAASASLLLDDVTLERAGGDEFFGAPLERLIALAGNGDGRISLALQLAGDGADVGDAFGSRGLAALRDALAERIAAPLLARSHAAGMDGDRSVRLPPLAFPRGAASPRPPEIEAADRLAVLLHRRPDLLATVRGRSGAGDGLAVRDAAARAALERARAEWVRARLAANAVPAERVRLEPSAPPGLPAVLVELVPVDGSRDAGAAAIQRAVRRRRPAG